MGAIYYSEKLFSTAIVTFEMPAYPQIEYQYPHMTKFVCWKIMLIQEEFELIGYL